MSDALAATSAPALRAMIIGDVVQGRFTDVQLAAFLTATATLALDAQETIHLIRAITSPADTADTADTMKILTPVDLDLGTLRPAVRSRCRLQRANAGHRRGQPDGIQGSKTLGISPRARVRSTARAEVRVGDLCIELIYAEACGPSPQPSPRGRGSKKCARHAVT